MLGRDGIPIYWQRYVRMKPQWISLLMDMPSKASVERMKRKSMEWWVEHQKMMVVKSEFDTEIP